MNKLFSLILTLIISTQVNANSTTKRIDKILNELFDKDGPGGVALVVKDGKTIYRKAFGMANLEYGIKMKPENVFQIGSITKQFTAMAIMKLVEQGKINLDDDITKFIKDYPTHGHKITIKHLLTHTSGIKSYTSIQNWVTEKRRVDSTPEEVIDYFKNEPMDFKPGEKERYTNSGYFLLGYIIEKVSGKPYGEYIENKLFKPLNMKNSSNGSVSKIIKNKVSGYEKSEEGYFNAEYWSISQAYAAGGLFSTVDDLSKWYSAVSSNQVVSESSFKRATSPPELNNGDKTEYAFGWQLGNIQGSPMIFHGGQMDGYATWSNFLINEKIFVAVFSNCMCHYPYEATSKIAALALEKPFEWETVKLDDELLKSYQGIYENSDSYNRLITFKNGKLFSARKGGFKYEIYPFAKDHFYFEDSILTIKFNRDSKDKVQTLSLLSTGKDQNWIKTDIVIPEYKAIDLDEETFGNYVGKYELETDFYISIMSENGIFYSQLTNQDKIEIIAFEKNKFILKGTDKRLTINFNENLKVISLTLHEGRDHEAMKVK
jgi:CubicO group peptidase (beta-lactamase class C family)